MHGAVPMIPAGVGMTIKGIQIYWGFMAVVALIILVSIGKLVYDTTSIFPPAVPQNLEELEQWPEKKLYRLTRHLECDRLPWSDEVPEELQELHRICRTASTIWVKKYKANRMKGLADDAREKLKHLRKNPKALPE